MNHAKAVGLRRRGIGSWESRNPTECHGSQVPIISLGRGQSRGLLALALLLLWEKGDWKWAPGGEKGRPYPRPLRQSYRGEGEGWVELLAPMLHKTSNK